MKVSDFDYELPPDRIAQKAVEPRDSARLMVLDRADGSIQHRVFRDLPEFLRKDDLLVLNDTRVMPWRLMGQRTSGGKIEGLLINVLAEGVWRALLKGKLKVGERIAFFEGKLQAELVAKEDFGVWQLQFLTPEAEGLIEQFGRAPLPPYIRREEPDAALDEYDRKRYQTTFAKIPGAIAAPTAGMHFTEGLLGRIREIGVEVATVTLHVGVGTFAPVRVEDVSEHRMHSEEYEVSVETAHSINKALAEGKRIVAVGTTSVRTIEHCLGKGVMRAERGHTEMFITPGYKFRGVGAMVTNFHLPKSTLMMLVSAFAGRERILEAYRFAVREGYRFFSYGDGMMII